MAEEKVNKKSVETIELLNKTLVSLIELKEELKNNSVALHSFIEKIEAPNIFNGKTQEIKQYNGQIQAIGHTLENLEKRSLMIEDLALFFKEERGNMNAWNGVVTKSIGEVDETLQESVVLLKESIAKQINELTKFTINQREHFEKYVDEQNKLLKNKTGELTDLTEELKHISGVKKGIQELQRLSEDQNRKFDVLAESIYKLMYDESKKNSIHQRRRIPNWMKVLLIIITVSLAGLLTISILSYTHQNNSPVIDSYEQFENPPIPYEKQ